MGCLQWTLCKYLTNNMLTGGVPNWILKTTETLTNLGAIIQDPLVEIVHMGTCDAKGSHHGECMDGMVHPCTCGMIYGDFSVYNLTRVILTNFDGLSAIDFMQLSY